MYSGILYGKRRKKRRVKKWVLVCLLAVTAGIGGIFMTIAESVLAAPEDPVVEAAMSAATEAAGGVSANSLMPEKVTKEDGIPLIIVDPGHGGEDEGCSREGVQEKDINLGIALLLRTKLNELGYQVILTREDDTYIAKEDRVESANIQQADIYVSIHQNAYEEKDASGIETWYYGADTARDSKRLAQLIHQETGKSTGAVTRELRDDAELCVTGQTRMPACLIETGFLSNKKERELLSTQEYQEEVADGIAAGIELYFHPKTMYLTFDDGPSEENTSAVLDILKARNIKATFFVIGENVRKHPEVARRIVAEGHTIGIHCNNHDYVELYKSVESYVQDFEDAYHAVLEVTGVEAKFFRFPGGSINSYSQNVYQGIVDEMTSRGFIYFDWNASLEDAIKKSNPDTLIENAVSTTLGRKKVVLLAHDVVYNTVLCLDELLDKLPEYKMLPLTEDVEPIQFKGKNTGADNDTVSGNNTVSGNDMVSGNVIVTDNHISLENDTVSGNHMVEGNNKDSGDHMVTGSNTVSDNHKVSDNDTVSGNNKASGKPNGSRKRYGL